jgi:hypothetical protein
MAKRQPSDHERPPRGGNGDGDYRKRPGRGDGDHDDDEKAEQLLFAELVQRRLGGGATPTAEAYAKAMRQWQALPGAVQFVAVPKSATTDAGGPATRHPDEPDDDADRI